MLARRLGYRVIERIIDNDRSASRKARRRREGFDRMLELVKAGDVDAVIVYDLDRFTRNPTSSGRGSTPPSQPRRAHPHDRRPASTCPTPTRSSRRASCSPSPRRRAANTARRVKREAQAAAEKGTPDGRCGRSASSATAPTSPAEAAELRAIYADVIAGPLAGVDRPISTTAASTNPAGARWQSATIGFLVRGRSERRPARVPRQGRRTGHVGTIVDEETWRQAVAALDARKAGRRQAPVRCSVGWCAVPTAAA